MSRPKAKSGSTNPIVRLYGRFRHSSEKGQILILTGFMAVVLFGVIGLAVDVARMYAAKAELGRAVDAAALAGVLEFPNTANAQTKATAYLTANDPSATPLISTDVNDNKLIVDATKSVPMYFISVLGISSVSISAHAAAGFGIAPVDTYLALDATGSMHTGCNASETTSGGGCPIKEARDAAQSFVDTLLVTGTNSGFTLVGLGSFRGCYNPPASNPGAIAAPGVGPQQPQYAEVASVPIQFTSLGSINNDESASAPLLAPSNTPTKTPVPPTATKTKTPVPPTATKTNTPVPPTATKTNTPVPPTATRTSTATATATPTVTNTVVPPTATPDYSNNNGCVQVAPAPTPRVTNLSSDYTALTTGIAAIHAVGGPGEPTSGSGTNICLALKMAESVIYGPSHHTEVTTRRYVVILSDGDNVYNATKAWQSVPQSPSDPCSPTNPSVSDSDVSPNCRTASNTTQAQQVDALSQAEANTLKAEGIVIYVVGLSPCAHDTTQCNTAAIGTNVADSVRNENLLKCMASNTAGTTDHYYYVSTASQLPGIFASIAHQIGHRLIE